MPAPLLLPTLAWSGAADVMSPVAEPNSPRGLSSGLLVAHFLVAALPSTRRPGTPALLE